MNTEEWNKGYEKGRDDYCCNGNCNQGRDCPRRSECSLSEEITEGFKALEAMRNNKPVAWRNLCVGNIGEDSEWIYNEIGQGEPLYTHPAKTPTLVLDGNRVYATVKTLTDEEINRLWAESHEDGIAIQQGFTTQQHYFAHLILRKASEK
jgi:hypothetical protein